jgi:hypothetical protein
MASAAPLAASNKLPRYVNTVVTQAKKRWLEPTDIARLLQQAHPLRELGLVATEPPLQPAGGREGECLLEGLMAYGVRRPRRGAAVAEHLQHSNMFFFVTRSSLH